MRLRASVAVALPVAQVQVGVQGDDSRSHPGPVSLCHGKRSGRGPSPGALIAGQHRPIAAGGRWRRDPGGPARRAAGRVLRGASGSRRVRLPLGQFCGDEGGQQQRAFEHREGDGLSGRRVLHRRAVQVALNLQSDDALWTSQHRMRRYRGLGLRCLLAPVTPLHIIAVVSCRLSRPPLQANAVCFAGELRQQYQRQFSLPGRLLPAPSGSVLPPPPRNGVARRLQRFRPGARRARSFCLPPGSARACHCSRHRHRC